MDLDIIKEYYGKTLKSTADLKTEACCTPQDLPAYVQRLLSNVHEEVRAKYYGCGLVAPWRSKALASSTSGAARAGTPIFWRNLQVHKARSLAWI